MQQDPSDIARASCLAYVHKDRAAIEALIADDFHFTSPPSHRLDRETCFARCFPQDTPERAHRLRQRTPSH